MASSWSRYANAYAQVVSSDTTAFEQLEGWGKLLQSVPDLGRFLARRDIPVQARKELVQTLSKGIDGPALKLMLLLIEQNLVSDFNRIIERVRSERDLASGQILVYVESAVTLDGEAEAELKKWLCKELDKKEVTVSVKVVPELIAGFIASAGSRRIDMSYQGRLVRLERQLVARA